MGEIYADVETENEIQVMAIQGGRILHTIDIEGRRVPLGHAIYRDYENNRSLRVPYLFPEGNTDPNGCILGRTSSKFQLVDHATVAEQMVAAGFTSVKQVKHFKNGADLFAEFVHPDVTFEDALGWDSNLYSGRGGEMHLAGVLKNSLRVGVGIQISLGFFRSVCTNGLVVSVLGMGHQSWNHLEFKPESMVSFLRERVEYFHEHGPAFTPGDSAMLDWPIQQINRTITDSRYPDTISSLARKPLARTRDLLAGWSFIELGQQLEQLRHNGDGVSVLDVLNAITNIANRDPHPDQIGDRAWVIYRRLEPIMANVLQLVDLGAMIADVPSLRSPMLN